MDQPCSFDCCYDNFWNEILSICWQFLIIFFSLQVKRDNVCGRRHIGEFVVRSNKYLSEPASALHSLAFLLFHYLPRPTYPHSPASQLLPSPHSRLLPPPLTPFCHYSSHAAHWTSLQALFMPVYGSRGSRAASHHFFLNRLRFAPRRRVTQNSALAPPRPSSTASS